MSIRSPAMSYYCRRLGTQVPTRPVGAGSWRSWETNDEGANDDVSHGSERYRRDRDCVCHDTTCVLIFPPHDAVSNTTTSSEITSVVTNRSAFTVPVNNVTESLNRVDVATVVTSSTMVTASVVNSPLTKKQRRAASPSTKVAGTGPAASSLRNWIMLTSWMRSANANRTGIRVDHDPTMLTDD